ncbi:MAG: hypothetical protein N2169_07120 [bacterium]|nr:hypothetical protein [bacterium]
MEGSFILGDQEYKFIIKNDHVIFNVSNEEVMSWRIFAEKNSYRMELKLRGKTSEGYKIIIITDFLLKIAKNEITLGIEAVFVFYGKVAPIKGICIKLDDNPILKLDTNTIKTIVIPNSEIEFSIEHNSIILITQCEATYEQIMSLSYLVINVLRFILQCDEIGRFKVYLLTDTENGYIAHCKGINKYYTDEANLMLNSEISRLNSNLVEIFDLMRQRKIYLAHISHNKKQNAITPGCFLTIMAAFEWEYRSLDFSNTTGKQPEIEKEILLEVIDKLIKKTSGKSKKHFKLYKKILGNIDLNLCEKLKSVFEKYENYLNPIAKQRFYLNNIEFKYTDMAERLASQRNNFAHGNLDKPLDVLSVLDIEVLKRLIYIIQLDKCRVDPEIIKSCFENVFGEDVYRREATDEYISKTLDAYLSVRGGSHIEQITER